MESVHPVFIVTCIKKTHKKHDYSSFLKYFHLLLFSLADINCRKAITLFSNTRDLFLFFAFAEWNCGMLVECFSHALLSRPE